MSGKGPLPPVDDPELEATLAKVTAAAGDLSKSRQPIGPDTERVNTTEVAGQLEAARARADQPVDEPSVELSKATKAASEKLVDDPDVPLPELAKSDPVRLPKQRAAAIKPSEPPPKAEVKAARSKRPPSEPPDDEDDGDDDRPKSRRGVLIVTLVILAALAIGVMVLLGRVNSTHYYLACQPSQVVAEQGRSFPPWGSSPMDGAQWAPIKIPPEAECVERETENPLVLADWYREMLVERAGAMLTGKGDQPAENAAEAAALLQQALLHARSDERRSERQDIERLLGDVEYWRAAAKLDSAQKALVDAAKQFEAAAAQRPRHVSDAAAWAGFVRQLASDLEAGPEGSTRASTLSPLPTNAAGERPVAPPGVALPVEPDRSGSGSPDPGEPGRDARPDAGVPTGGVLL